MPRAENIPNTQAFCEKMGHFLPAPRIHYCPDQASPVVSVCALTCNRLGNTQGEIFTCKTSVEFCFDKHKAQMKLLLQKESHRFDADANVNNILQV